MYDIVVGVKVRVGAEASGRNGTRPLELAIEVAERMQVPVMAHVGTPPPDLRNVMKLLRPGDIWTHCFRPEANAIVPGEGQVGEEITAAQARRALRCRTRFQQFFL